MQYQNNIMTFGLDEDEVQKIESVRPTASTIVRNADDFTDLIAIGSFALIINWDCMTIDNKQILFDYYTEVEAFTENVVLLGTPTLPAHLQKCFSCYATFEDIIPNLKYILLSAYRKTQKVENFSATLANAILILSRIRKHPGVTTKELAEQLEIAPRSVQRYVETLRMAGEWIDYDRDLHGWKLSGGKSVLWGDFAEEYRGETGNAE